MFKKQYAPVGSRPGTLNISEHLPQPRVAAIKYSLSEHQSFPVSLENLLDSRFTKANLQPARGEVVWLDIQGLGDDKLIRAVGDKFGLHALTLADIINIPQRPKSEFYDSYCMYIGMMLPVAESTAELKPEQVTVLWGDRYVITFQERYGDLFDPVRERIRLGKGQMRKSGSDYLAYALIDTLVDAYFPVLEMIGEELERLEDRVVFRPTDETLREVYRIKRELLNLRRSVWPQREALGRLVREDASFVKQGTRVFLRDTYEHVAQVIDVLETYREVAGSFMDVYLSSLSNKMNEVMKVLTIIGTIFIPLSFLAGIYGMNFENMPELKHPWAYPIFWVFVLSIASGMLVFFWRRGWLGASSAEFAEGVESSSINKM